MLRITCEIKLAELYGENRWSFTGRRRLLIRQSSRDIRKAQGHDKRTSVYMYMILLLIALQICVTFYHQSNTHVWKN